MSVLDLECAKGFIRLCEDAFAHGWHEANGGNLSYRMDEEDVDACSACFSREGTWISLEHPAPSLAGAHFLITGSGKYLRNAVLDPAQTFGIVEVDNLGAAWRVAWGLEGAGPSSELETHLATYETALQVSDGANRVVYHAHCPNIIALSTLLPVDMNTWTRALWKVMTESIIVFPQGIGVLPWMIPGSPELAQATCELMRAYKVCVWTQHGVMVRAASFDEAFGLVHTVEKSCGIYLQARAANGGEDPQFLVSDEQLRLVCARYGLTPNEDLLC